MDARGVRELLKIKLAREFHGDAKVAAERTGLDIDHFKAIIAGRQSPGLRLLKYLGLKKVIYYEFDGLPPKDGVER